jgi:predicted secreted protein
VRAGAALLLLIVWAIALPPPAAAQSAQHPSTVLHLNQTAERKVMRDQLRIELRVEETGPDAQGVQSAINRRMAAALGRARQVQGVEVETGAYSVGEEEPQNQPVRWRGSQSLILTGKAADAMLTLAGALQSDGLLMSSLAYEVSPETLRGAEEDLTNEALAGLGLRAASIAERLHLAVIGYQELRVGNAETSGQPMPRFAAAMAKGSPVAAPGETTVRLTVTAAVLLGPAGP